MPPEAGRLSGAAIVAGAQSAAIATDGDGRIRAWNEGARMLLGHVASRACARHFGELLEPKDVHGNPLVWPLIPFAEVVTRGEPLRPFEITVRSARGDRVPVTVSVVVVLDRASEKEELVYLLLRRYRRRRSDEIIERLLAQPEPALQARRRPDPSRAAAPKLSPRRAEVLHLLAGGASTAAMATELGVSVDTVRSHVQAVLHALDARNRVQAVSKAYKLRLL